MSFWHQGCGFFCLALTMDPSPGGAGLCASVYQRFLWMDLCKTHLDGSGFSSPALPLRFGPSGTRCPPEQRGDPTCLLGRLAMPGPQKSCDIRCETAPGLRLLSRLGVFLSKGFINYLVRGLLSSRTET